MEFNGSLKDVPIPPKDIFIRDLVLKMQDLIRRVRWKVNARLYGADLTDKNNIEEEYKRNFNSMKIPPANVLYPFEDAIWEMVRNIHFHKYPNKRNKYLRDLNTKLKEIRDSGKISVLSD